ncbi:aldo/keto reductase [Oribacterium sp. WCC10]|uniref:aldo/keto reductase n=1 Tax=Oribacterium sp. WCC10 TaxID=1855343 RepID=UPI0008E82E1F|nr:aldo/keto reductase [Oribacterium sp. WCC10]SFG77322.1 Aldo/keto reductase [Oribacterium sp. WCC10]
MKHEVTLGNGIKVPALGQGTWYLGESSLQRKREIDGIRKGIEAGMTLIDTAEMYGNGAAEDMLGEAISTVDRKSLYLVSKVLPTNAGGKRMRQALQRSLSRMGVDYLDLYLYHWRGSFKLSETVSRLEELRAEGLIKAWGVSNFDIDDMEELWSVPDGKNCLVNQVLYHTGSRGIEYSLLPWMLEHNVALMSYCPLAQAGSLKRGLMQNHTLEEIAKKYGVAVPEILLAWNIRNGHTIAIPRSSRPEHTLSNAHADSIELTEEELALIDKAYPAPTRKEYLDMQ